MLGNAGDDVGIEILRLGAVVDVKNLLPVPGLDTRLAPTAAAECGNGENEEQRARFRRRAVGFVFQSFNLLPTLSVAENLALPLALNGLPGQQRIPQMLARLGLTERAGRYPNQLSGGEQQRVAIGRALIHTPPLVLADEPTGNLDEDTARQVTALLCEMIRETGSTLVMATHSSEPRALADRVLRLQQGQLQEER
jgi:putative ABC transport system ATP-binding protein